MSDSSSPVRASAQELEHFFDVVEACQRESPKEGLDWDRWKAAYYAFKALDVPALRAAEARGRQQAEQAVEIAAEDCAKLLMRVAALTQALKDYGQHQPFCAISVWLYGVPTARPNCTCGLDAALTGAQA